MGGDLKPWFYSQACSYPVVGDLRPKRWVLHLPKGVVEYMRWTLFNVNAVPGSVPHILVMFIVLPMMVITIFMLCDT